MMKNKIFFLLLSCVLCTFSSQAIIHVIDIPIDGSNTYSPSELTIQLGDSVMFSGSPYHPTTHVSEATWNANGITPISDALFESVSAPYTFKPTTAGMIYYVCDLHVQMGMKGTINVESANVGIGQLAYDNSTTFEFSRISRMAWRYEITSMPHSTYRMSILNLSGQEIYGELVETETGTIELHIPLGIYIVALKDENNRLVYKETILMN